VEGGGETVLASVKEMLTGLLGVQLILTGWQSWPNFRKTITHMHLLLQPSYTESFNMVTADGVAEGVPSVVSSAIDWAPDDWKAKVDDVLDIARVGRRLVHDGRATATLRPDPGSNSRYLCESLPGNRAAQLPEVPGSLANPRAIREALPIARPHAGSSEKRCAPDRTPKA
jgi:hypothetical protein